MHNARDIRHVGKLVTVANTSTARDNNLSCIKSSQCSVYGDLNGKCIRVEIN